MKNNSGAFAAGVLLVIVGLWIANILNISFPVTVKNTTVEDMAVVGVGKVDVVPDTAQVTFGVRADEKPTVQAVEAQINEISNKVVAAIKKEGIDSRNIKTMNYSINPNFDYSDSNRSQQGYSGNTTVEVRIQPTEKIAAVIAAATAAGASEVLNTNFTVDSPEKYRAQARTKAIQNAKEEAKKIGKELGIKIGKPTNIVESSSDSPIVPFAAEKSLDTGTRVAPALEEGTQTITSTVTVYFENL